MTTENVQGKLTGIKVALVLEHTPIGLAFVDEPPPGLLRPDRPVPSGCSFWRMAEREALYTGPEDHNCPIGVMTMGFQIPPDKEAEANALCEVMCDCAYISPEEISQIPGIQRDHRGIVYGPLGHMPVEPDVAFFICRPGHAMMLAEATGEVAWRGGLGAPAFGRPACAAISMALKTGLPSMSLGWIGSRVYATLSDDEMLMAIPDSVLPHLAENLDVIIQANSTMEKLHTERRAQF